MPHEPLGREIVPVPDFGDEIFVGHVISFHGYSIELFVKRNSYLRVLTR